jgi:hypothetical protein
MASQQSTTQEILEKKVRRSQRSLAAYYRKKGEGHVTRPTPQQRAIKQQLREQVEEESMRRVAHAPLLLQPWFSYATADERRTAIIAKIDREQPQPRS